MSAPKHTAEAAHYGDPCLYCGSGHDAVAVGPCPARIGNKPGERVRYVMSQSDFQGLIEAIRQARNTPLIALNAGMPLTPQEAANAAWSALGERLGFEAMTVEPGPSPFEFTAIAVEA